MGYTKLYEVKRNICLLYNKRNERKILPLPLIGVKTLSGVMEVPLCACRVFFFSFLFFSFVIMFFFYWRVERMNKC